MHFERQNALNYIFFPEKYNPKKCVCLPYLKFSDRNTLIFFIWPYECSVIITCASTLALSTSVLESAISPLTAQPKHKKMKNSVANFVI